MSLAETQAALALLIRLPEQHRGEDLEPFLGRFDLSSSERDQIRSLARDNRVVKYGRSMRGVRLQQVERRLRLVKRYLSLEAIHYLYRGPFESSATLVPSDRLDLAFLQFLLVDPEAQRVLREAAPPFITDVIKLDLAQARLRREITRERCPAPETSRLVHHAFLIIDLNHDVPGVLQRLSQQEKDASIVPDERTIKVLLVAREGPPGCRMFEIDTAVQEYLSAEREGRQGIALPRESCDELVRTGILRPLSVTATEESCT